MARRRMIEVTIAHDKAFNSLSDFEQLLFLKILPHTDDYGRFEGDPEVVKARVDPLSKRKISIYNRAMTSIAESGLWLWYETDMGRKVVQYKKETFERINAFLIKKRGNEEFPEFNKDLYKVISGDMTYKATSRKQQVESNKRAEAPGNGEMHSLQKYILTLPNVSALRDQLTKEECDLLIKDYPKTIIMEILLAMENKADLTRKYKSVNLTLRNWIRMREKRDGRVGNPAQQREPLDALVDCKFCGEQMTMKRLKDHKCKQYDPKKEEVLA